MRKKPETKLAQIWNTLFLLLLCSLCYLLSVTLQTFIWIGNRRTVSTTQRAHALLPKMYSYPSDDCSDLYTSPTFAAVVVIESIVSLTLCLTFHFPFPEVITSSACSNTFSFSQVETRLVVLYFWLLVIQIFKRYLNVK